MYLVFIAMLALNIPAEVLDGFVLVNDKLQVTIENTVDRNNQMYTEMDEMYKSNPEKTQKWYNESQEVKQKTDSLFNYIQTLKLDIVVASDGKDADINDLKKKDNLDAATEIMLAPNKGQGEKLKLAIDHYRESIMKYIGDSEKSKLIETLLSTEPTARAKREGKNWQESSFEQMPTIAAVTFLSEIQSNVKQAEGEAMSSLLKNVDVSDLRVNQLNAYVIPESKIVMSGTEFKANIILAAVDTTQRPRIVVNGRELPKDRGDIYQIPSGAIGQHIVEGFIELMGRDGVAIKRPFKEEYTVIEPMATVAPLLMDVVYAGINNPISISVPGLPNNAISATAEGGALTPNGNTWNARPTAVGGKFIVNVSGKVNGTQRLIARKEFRIRQLPDPTAYIEYQDDKGVIKRFKGGTISRSAILNAGGIKASIDDGILNIGFTVLSFRTIFVDAMGNSVADVSEGTRFSARQLEQIRKVQRGKYFFIAGIRVKGPDGVERDINAIDLRVN